MTLRIRPRLPLPSVIAAVLLATPAWSNDILRRHVEFLASAELGGRLTGSAEERRAADYLAAELTKLGAEALPCAESLLIPFEFTAGTRDSGSSLRLSGAGDGAEGVAQVVWKASSQVQALSFSDSGKTVGAAVFAGYGLSLPEQQDTAYDSYATLDVEDKVVVVLRYVPEDLEQDRRAALARYSGLRYKALSARERGAKAILVVTGPRSPNAGELVPMTFDTAISGSGILAASINGEVAAALFETAGRDLEAVQRELDSGNPHVVGFELPGVELELTVQVERERRTGHNVVGLFPGKGTEVERPYVVVGAHYDHLGRGRHGNSLARNEEAGEVHRGADDNASGVAAVLEVARSLAERERRRHLVFGLWSGEELGLLGSSAFAKNGCLDSEGIAAYVNFDMVGRMRNNRLSLQAVGSSPLWPRLIEQSNVPVGFDLKLQDDPYLPTDSATFNQIKVPSVNFFTGSHSDYHRPSDLPEAINYEDLDRVAHLGALLTAKLTDLDEVLTFAQVEHRVQEGGSRDTVRAFTGTIPDYTTEVEGLLLGGVIEGGPADEAGLREGDVIVQFGSQKITNIYDYTYALDAVKIDQPLQVRFLRDGEVHETKITPRGRR